MRRITAVVIAIFTLVLGIGSPANASKNRKPAIPKPPRPATRPVLEARAGAAPGKLTLAVTVLVPGGSSGRRLHATCVSRRLPPPPTSLHWDEFDTEDYIAPDGTPATRQVYRRTKERISLACGDNTYEATRCTNGDCPEPAPVPPSGADVAAQLIDELPLAQPVPILSPALDRPDASIIVGLPFFWAVDPAQWEPITLGGIGCVQTACVSAEATAVPTYVYLEPGDEPGRIDTCQRPGTVVRSAEEADAAGDDCAYVFQNRGNFNGAVGIHYEITWTSTDPNNPGGTDAQDIERRVALPVTEVQAVITG